MNKCEVYFGEDEQCYEGQYEIEENSVEVEVFNYFSSENENASIGLVVKNKKIKIFDLRNKLFLFSPVFYNSGVSFDLTQYEKFKTDFYFSTTVFTDVGGLSPDIKIDALRIYNPMLVQCFRNGSLSFSYNNDEFVYKINRNVDPVEVEINTNNISKIEFGNEVRSSNKYSNQQISIESENYVKIYFIESISYEDILKYIKEFDVFIDAYCLAGMRSYKTYITSSEGKIYDVVHKLLGKEKYCESIPCKFIKMNFFDFMGAMYKNTNYRSAENRNRYLPLELKKPTSLEDQYTYYFRCIDLYMGNLLRQETGEEPSNFSRLSRFVDDFESYFNKDGTVDIGNLKNELNSLRNHYVHEGYYLPNNEFKVTKNREFQYNKQMDYQWLLRMVNVFKFGAYKILYTKILGLEIDEAALINSLKCWF